MIDDAVNDAERLRRTAFHESGHAVVATALGRRVTFLSVRPGKHFSGIAPYAPPRIGPNAKLNRPAILQPAAWRRSLEIMTCVSLAGDIAGDLVSPRTGYIPPTEDQQLAEKVAQSLARLSRRDAKYLKTLERQEEPFIYDGDSAAETAWLLSGEEAAQHLAYLRAVTRRLVYDRSRSISVLAEVLEQTKTLSGQRVREILQSDSGRAVRSVLTQAKEGNAHGS